MSCFLLPLPRIVRTIGYADSETIAANELGEREQDGTQVARNKS